MNTIKQLKRFGIYHPKDGSFNMTCKLDTHDYEYVGSVEAQTLVQVMYRAQNEFNPAYASLGRRSTSVGDIVVCDKTVHMIRPLGYKRIPTTKELYKKIIQTDEAVIEILSREKLTEENVKDLLDNCL